MKSFGGKQVPLTLKLMKVQLIMLLEVFFLGATECTRKVCSGSSWKKWASGGHYRENTTEFKIMGHFNSVACYFHTGEKKNKKTQMHIKMFFCFLLCTFKFLLFYIKAEQLHVNVLERIKQDNFLMKKFSSYLTWKFLLRTWKWTRTWTRLFSVNATRFLKICTCLG